MTEPDVAITDFLLAAEAFVFVAVLCRRSAWTFRLGRWLVVFFASVGAASLCGGLFHGFFLDHPFGYDVLWRAVLIFIGSATLAKCAVGAELLFRHRTACVVTLFAAAGFVAYLLSMLSMAGDFRIAVAFNLPGAVFLLIAFAIASRRARDSRLMAGAAGMALTLCAGTLQQWKVGLHPAYFNHNAVYHLLQGIALFLVFLAAFRLVQTRTMPSIHPGDAHEHAS